MNIQGRRNLHRHQSNEPEDMSVINLDSLLEAGSEETNDTPGVDLHSLIDDEENVHLQDLFNSPEFVREQQLLFLEFEAARLCIGDTVESPRRQENRRSRRSSIGIKLDCPICLETLSSSRCSCTKMVTECGHIFCQECIEAVCENGKCKATKPLCPVCREEVGQLRKVHL